MLLRDLRLLLGPKKPELLRISKILSYFKNSGGGGGGGGPLVVPYETRHLPMFVSAPCGTYFYQPGARRECIRLVPKTAFVCLFVCASELIMCAKLR